MFCRIAEKLSQPYGLQDCISYGNRNVFWNHHLYSKDLANSGLTHKIDGMTGMGEKDPNSTLFTTQVGRDIIMKQNRPAVIISSTSWLVVGEVFIRLDYAF